MKKLLGFVLATIAFWPLPLASQAADPAPESAAENLELVEQSRRGELLLDTSADWNRYTKIQLERATVEFRKNWARDQRNRGGVRPREDEMERIRNSLSDLLDEVFTRELTENGTYTMSDETGDNVMRITPRIVELNINAPDRMRDHIGYSLTDSQGSMTLKLEIHDSVSGALLARARDNREDPRKGFLEWTTSGTNRRSARLMLMRWATGLRDWLEEARAAAEN